MFFLPLLAMIVQSPEWVNSQAIYGSVFVADEQDNNRKKRTPDSPRWLEAIGRLGIGERQRHCSASLLHDVSSTQGSGTVVTAAHCVAGYSPASMTVTFWGRDQRPLYRAISSVEHIGVMPWGDWAILTLNERVKETQIPALRWGKPAETHVVQHVIAGYSGDHTTRLGNGGRDLTFDTGCILTDPKSYSYWIKLSHCYAYPGASGGAYIAIDEKGQPYWQGSLSSIRPSVNYVVPASAITPFLISPETPR